MMEIFLVWIKTGAGTRWLDTVWLNVERAQGRRSDILAAIAWNHPGHSFDVTIQTARLMDAMRAEIEDVAAGEEVGVDVPRETKANVA